jgi:hypothetical protein
MRRVALPPHKVVHVNRTELVGWIISSEGLRSANYGPVVPYRVHYRRGMAGAFFCSLDDCRCFSLLVMAQALGTGVRPVSNAIEPVRKRAGRYRAGDLLRRFKGWGTLPI